MKITNLIIAAASLLLFNSCKKSATSDQALQYQIQTTNRTAVVNAPLSAGSITWTSGTATASLIKLEAKNSNNTEVEFKSTLNQQIDLFAPIATSLGNVVIPPGTYSEVEFKIDLTPNGSAPSLVLNGQFTSGTGVITPVIFQVNSMVEIKAEQTNVTITSTSGSTALTSVNLALLTVGISQTMLNSATLTNGKIIISATSNTALFDIITANVIKSHEVEVHH